MAFQFDVTDIYMSAKTPEEAAKRVSLFTGVKLATEEHHMV